ncbi:hypothetical protein ACWF0M_01495 [Kribbella sp. NPDC055110]
MDIDTLEPGEEFRDAIRRAIGECNVFLAMIGRQWLNLSDAQGRRRLENPEDLARIEIETALKLEVAVVPVLIRGAGMPAEEDLPASLARLAALNGFELSDTRWDYDAGQLMTWLKKLEARHAKHSAKPRKKSPIEKATEAAIANQISTFTSRHRVGEVVEGRMGLFLPKHGYVVVAGSGGGFLPSGAVNPTPAITADMPVDSLHERVRPRLGPGALVRVKIEEIKPPVLGSTGITVSFVSLIDD